jgi:tRNA (guanine37-N1)-methyltransferase
MLNFQIFSLFPQLFPGPLAYSITGEALNNKLWSLQTINMRDYATDKRGTVDDIVYGGGSGMLLKPDVVYNAITANIKQPSKLLYLSPRGKVLSQQMAVNFATEQNIAILCGRYEGIDQRVLDELDIQEVSIGDYILSGGELACYVLIDCILRCLPDVLGDANSLEQESFSGTEYAYLLEYPQYTRPAVWQQREVPAILLSGHHKNIEQWRKQQAEAITKQNRPDLFAKYLLNK